MTERAGLVFCGGGSTRMGQAKAWLDFGGEPLLHRMVRRVTPAVDRVIVSASPGQSLPELTGSVTRVDDDVAGRGPLEGLSRGLAAADQLGCRVVFAVAVDLPLLTPELISRLLSRLGPEDDAVVPIHEGRRQPLVAGYRTCVRRVIEEMLAADRRALQELLGRIKVREVHPEAYGDLDAAGRAFLNLNTPADLETARKLAGGRD